MKQLTEATRSQLLHKTKTSDKEADGKTRFDKRLQSRIASSNREYNKIDMNQFFKKDILIFSIPVSGETDNYLITLRFTDVLLTLQEMIEPEDELTTKVIIQALVRCFNSNDVYVFCSCDDYKYRQAYWSTRDTYNSGPPEMRPANITNPNDTKGGGCKHIMLVLSNTAWMIKVASVIKNYITYIQKHYEKQYADIIYPKLYGVEYTDTVQLRIDNDIEDDVIDTANEYARKKNRFTSDTAPRFLKRDIIDDSQLTLDDET